MVKYYSLMLTKNISKTPEGYLICQNVPLCRSGSQEYYGRELEVFDGFDPDWKLNSDTKYEVFRPREEVLHPDFIASLEGKTVVDEHPEGNVVHIDNEQDVNNGHVQNVRVGPEIDGEVTLQGDIHIKHPDLIDKVRPESDPENEYGTATREVSCGYGLKLKRLDNGKLVMYRYRGNHVAVVGKGRAGPRIAIKDSAPLEIIKTKEKPMSIRDVIFGRGVKAVLGDDVTPEQQAAILQELTTAPAAIVVPTIAADSAPVGPPVKEEIHPAHESLEKLLGAMKAGDAAAVEAHKSDLFKHIGHEDHKPEEQAEEKPEELEEHQEEPHAHDGESEDDENHDDEEHHDENESEGHAGDANGEGEKIDDLGESVLKAANDSVRGYIKSTRPLVALIANKPKSKRSQHEQIMLDSHNGAVKALNKTGKNAYKVFAKTKIPHGISTGVAADAAPQPTSCTCFDGVPYREGAEKHRNTCMKENK